MVELTIRRAVAQDRPWMRSVLQASWGSPVVVSRGRSRDASRLPGLVALCGRERIGLATFETRGGECELVTLDALRRHRGVGSRLLAEVVARAEAQGARRVWLVTSNDNLEALRFYQRRGLRLVAVHRGGVDEARRLKASIPLVGEHGIPLRDELELEIVLGPTGSPDAPAD